MKKRLVLVLIFFVSIFLVGCKEESNLIALEEAIGDLQSRLEEVEKENDSLKSTVTLLELDKADLLTEIEQLTETLEAMDEENGRNTTAVANLRRQLIEAQKELEALDKKIEQANKSIVVHMADEYYLVVGDNFQLFYRSIVQAVNPYGYYIKFEGTVGNTYNRYYEFNPTTTGTYTIKVSVCDDNGYVHGSDETVLIVSDNKVSAAENKEKTILCMGDSLTANGVWVAQGVKRATEAGFTKIKTLGQMSKTLGTTTVNYEGHSGWQWSTYLTGDKSKDTPFRSTTDPSKISFKEYCAKYGANQIDELYILLTWNGIGGRFKEFTFKDTIGSNAKQFIDQFHQEFPNAKITLIGIPLPSVNAGLGAYYSIDLGYGDNYGQLVTAFNYNDFLKEWCKMEEYSSFMTYVDGKGQFDSEYNMPTEGKPVNNQNNTTEPVGNAMGMHPTNNGYMQLGDVFYRVLMKRKK